MATFHARRDGHILNLTFGTAGVHSLMDEAWFAEFEGQLDDARNDAEVRVVLLASHGKGFCAGGDLKEFHVGPWPGGYLNSNLVSAMRRLGEFDKPIVAAVHGAAIGGGTTVLLNCDFVYCTPDARFQLPFTRLGIVPELGSSHLLPLFAGMRLATELVLLGRPFDPSTAQRAGIVNEIVASERLLPHARETAAALAELPPASLRATKRIMKAAQAEGFAKAWLAECKALETCLAGPEVRESTTAFIEKRQPDFSRFK